MPRILEGPPAAAALTGALARVTALVPHLTAAVDPPASPEPPRPPSVPADGAWVPSVALLDDPAWLGRIITTSGAGLGTDDPVVAASAFVQSYSYRLLAVTVACLCTAGVVPDASAPRTAVALSGHWPSLLGFPAPAVAVLDDDPALLPADAATITDVLGAVVDQCITRHLRLLLHSVRAGLGTPVGERLLWGDVAAAAATAFRTMDGCLGPWVQPLGARFFTLAPPELHGLGSFRVVEAAGHRGWFWERSSCCLLDRLAGGIRCADCSLTSADDRRRAYREALAR